MSLEKKSGINITFREGEKTSPLAVFIHGMGMDKHIWTEPEKSRILAGRYPLTVLLREKPASYILPEKSSVSRKITLGTSPETIKTLWQLLKERGYHILTWSQKRPVAEASVALHELKKILLSYVDATKHGIIIIGHSRGGLIGRRYALEHPEDIRAVISVAAPHMGSSLARWAELVSKTLLVMTPFFQKAQKGTIKNSVKQVLDFINSKAVRELLPESEFLSSIKKPLPRHIKSLSIAGSSPSLFTLYSWHTKRIRKCDKRKKYQLKPKKLFSFPTSLQTIAPETIVPDELLEGRGDGLVSIGSAIAEDSDGTGIYPSNHAGILFYGQAQKKILAFIENYVGLL